MWQCKGCELEIPNSAPCHTCRTRMAKSIKEEKTASTGVISMQISDLIMEQKYEYITKFGREPVYLYLGKAEWEQLKQEVLQPFKYSENENAGNTFDNLLICRVMETSHINVAS